MKQLKEAVLWDSLVSYVNNADCTG